LSFILLLGERNDLLDFGIAEEALVVVQHVTSDAAVARLMLARVEVDVQPVRIADGTQIIVISCCGRFGSVASLNILDQFLHELGQHYQLIL